LTGRTQQAKKITKINIYHRDVAQLVARLLWEQDTEPTPDKKQKRRKALQTLTFLVLYSLAKSSIKVV